MVQKGTLCFLLGLLIFFNISLPSFSMANDGMGKDTLLPGDVLPRFDLRKATPPDADLGKQNEKGLFLCFVFETSCVPCNSNIPFWNKAARLFEAYVCCYGVLSPRAGDEAESIAERLFFDLYIHENGAKFNRLFGLGHDHQAVSLLYRNNLVLEVHYGHFDGESFLDFLHRCKKHLL